MVLKTEGRTPLAELPPGSAGRLEVAGSRPVPRRLAELGLVAGTRVAVVRRGPLGDPVEIELRGYRLCVRRSDLADFEVVVEDGPTR